MRDRVDRADLVLTSACGHELIANLRTRFRADGVVVVGLDELAHEISTPAERATHRHDTSGVNELTEGSTVDDLVEAFLRESIEYSTRHRVPSRIAPRTADLAPPTHPWPWTPDSR